MRSLAALAERWRPAGLCELCRRWSPRALCADCLGQHAAAARRCRHCGLRIATEVAPCGRCQSDPPPFERCVCLADYAYPWDSLIRALKFHDRVELAGPLADALADVLGDDAAWPDLIVPVPLAPARLRERGYNQAWELARRLARRTGRSAHPGALARPVDGAHQAGLDRAARQRQMRGAFIAEPGVDVASRRIALVDDVLTTGATAAEAARALLRAGAAGVQVWVVARTP